MNLNVKPMRGTKYTKELTDFPYLVSPKIDGLRAYVKDGVVLSKTGKPIPNQHVQRLFGHLHGADAELAVGPMNAQSEDDDVFARSRGPIMSIHQEADFQLYVFDRWDTPKIPAIERVRFCAGVPDAWKAISNTGVNFVVHHLVRTSEQVEECLENYLSDRFEGLMLRRADSHYKYGTSTEREGALLKLKPMETAEAIILAVVEQQTNLNEKTRDEQGYAKRSASAAGKVNNGTFGAFLVRDLITGVEFSVGMGPGLTAAMRADLWSRRETLPGQIITYRFQRIGSQVAPRLPAFLRFRDAIDTDECAAQTEALT